MSRERDGAWLRKENRYDGRSVSYGCNTYAVIVYTYGASRFLSRLFAHLLLKNLHQALPLSFPEEGHFLAGSWYSGYRSSTSRPRAGSRRGTAIRVLGMVVIGYRSCTSRPRARSSRGTAFRALRMVVIGYLSGTPRPRARSCRITANRVVSAAIVVAGVTDAVVPSGRELERVKGQDPDGAAEERQVERLVVRHLRAKRGTAFVGCTMNESSIYGVPVLKTA